MEILEHLIGYSHEEVSVERLEERFEHSPVNHVADIRSFLFSAAIERGLVEDSKTLVDRQKDKQLKSTLLHDISILTGCLKRRDTLPSCILLINSKDKEQNDTCCRTDIKSRFGFNWSDDEDNSPPACRQDGHFVSYRVQQSNTHSTHNYKRGRKRRKHSSVKELKTWMKRINKEFAETEKHKLTVKYIH